MKILQYYTIESPFFHGEGRGRRWVDSGEGRGETLIDGGVERGKRLVGGVADELVASVIVVHCVKIIFYLITPSTNISPEVEGEMEDRLMKAEERVAEFLVPECTVKTQFTVISTNCFLLNPLITKLSC